MTNNNADSSVVEAIFKTEEGYNECDHCQSVLSPAAYFVKLVETIRKYIEKPKNSNGPDPIQLLKARRPDLFELPLNCDSTNKTKLYLEIVNEVIEKNLGTSAMQEIATAKYPFNLPANIYLMSIRSYLEKHNVSLADIYKKLISDSDNTGAESLGLSPEEYKLITLQNITEEHLRELYKIAENKSLYSIIYIDNFAQVVDQLITNPDNAGIKGKTNEEKIQLILDSYNKIQKFTDSEKLSIYSIGNQEAINRVTTKELDFLYRFIYLVDKLGWSFGDLTEALVKIGKKDIDAECIKEIAIINKITLRFKKPLNEILRLYSKDVLNNEKETLLTNLLNISQSQFSKIKSQLNIDVINSDNVNKILDFFTESTIIAESLGLSPEEYEIITSTSSNSSEVYGASESELKNVEKFIAQANIDYEKLGQLLDCYNKLKKPAITFKKVKIKELKSTYGIDLQLNQNNGKVTVKKEKVEELKSTYGIDLLSQLDKKVEEKGKVYKIDLSLDPFNEKEVEVIVKKVKIKELKSTYGIDLQLNQNNGKITVKKEKVEELKSTYGIDLLSQFNKKVEEEGEVYKIDLSLDPFNEKEVIVNSINFDNTELGFLHRFIRLTNKLDWSFDELSNVLIAIGKSEIDADSLKQISRIKSLQEKFKKPLDKIFELYSHSLPNSVSNKIERLPRELSEQIKASLKENYQKLKDLATTESSRNILQNILDISNNELTNLIDFNSDKTTSASNKTGESWLLRAYKQVLLARLINIPIAELMQILSPSNVNELSVDDIEYIVELKDWLKEHSITTKQLDEIVNFSEKNTAKTSAIKNDIEELKSKKNLDSLVNSIELSSECKTKIKEILEKSEIKKLKSREQLDTLASDPMLSVDCKKEIKGILEKLDTLINRQEFFNCISQHTDTKPDILESTYGFVDKYLIQKESLDKNIPATNAPMIAVGDQAIFFNGKKVDVYNNNETNVRESWTIHTNTEEHVNPSIAIVGKKATFFCGQKSNSEYSKQINIYDANEDDAYKADPQNRWTTAEASEARECASVTVVNNKAIFFGGKKSENEYSKKIDIYDENSKSWSTETVNEARENASVAIVDDKVIFFGGNIYSENLSNSKYSKKVDIYDVERKTLLEPHEVTEGRLNPAVAVINDKAIFFGGYSNSRSNEAVSTPSSERLAHTYDKNPMIDIYDAKSNEWTSPSYRTHARGNVAFAVVNKKAIFFGGKGPGQYSQGFSSVIDVYNDAEVDPNEQWTKYHYSEVEARYGLSTAVIGAKAIFFSGISDEGYSKQINIYDDNDQETPWSINTTSEGRSDSTIVTIGKEIIFFCGKKGQDSSSNPICSNKIDIYDSAEHDTKNSWRTCEASEGRVDVSFAVVDKKVIFFGGKKDKGQYSSKIDIYDSGTKSWITVETHHAIKEVESIIQGKKVTFIVRNDKNDIQKYIIDYDKVVERLLESSNLFLSLKLQSEDIGNIVKHGQNHDITIPWSINNIDSIKSVLKYKTLRNKFLNFTNYLDWFYGENYDESKVIEKIADLTGWNLDTLEKIKKDEAFSKYFNKEKNPVDSLLKITSVIDLIDRSGINASLLLTLKELSEKDAQRNWDDYKNVEENLKLVTKIDEKEDKIIGNLEEKKCDILSSYMMHHSEDFKKYINNESRINKRDLSYYLLIDVEISGCSRISPLKAALNSLQFYIHRCMMRLEKGTTVNKDLNEKQWKLLSSYRQWEANNKRNLYPENYLNPTLRKNKTPEYTTLQNTLMQGNLTDEVISDVYVKYFEELEEVSSLKIVDSYFELVEDRISEKENNTLYIFGRTIAEPYNYYYRTAIFCQDNQKIQNWTHWQKIDASITVETITPIYAFNRLFIFWVQKTEKKEVDTKNYNIDSNKNSPLPDSPEVTINYIFQKPSGSWSAPQELASNIKIEPVQEADKLYWKKVAAFYLKEQGGDARRIVISIGEIKSGNKASSNLFTLDEDLVVSKKKQGIFFDGFISYEDLNENNEYANKLAEKEVIIGSKKISFRNGQIDTYDDTTKSSTTIKLGSNITELINVNVHDAKVEFIVKNSNDKLLKYVCSHPSYDIIRHSSKLSLSFTKNVFKSNVTNKESNAEFLYQNVKEHQLKLLEKFQISSVQQVNNKPGWFIIEGKHSKFENIHESFLLLPQGYDLSRVSEKSDYEEHEDKFEFEYQGKVPQKANLADIKFSFIRLNINGSISELRQKAYAGGYKKILTPESQQIKQLKFTRFQPSENVINLPRDYLDFSGFYGIYLWELFFHIPTLIAWHLNQEQKFSESRKWYQYVFNPTSFNNFGKMEPWKFSPFEESSEKKVENKLNNTQCLKNLEKYSSDPYSIADLRTTTYEKYIIMSYVKNLISWGDMVFRQSSWEGMNKATILYLRAWDILGDKPKKKRKLVIQETKNVCQLLGDKNNICKIEAVIPVNICQKDGVDTNRATGDITAYSNYFCTPANEDFIGLWDKVQDSLYKIRYCLDFKGKRLELPLFQPPIDPGQLARIAGDDVIGISQAGQTRHYRFRYMISYAKSIADTVTQIGSELLSVLEKKDAEALTMLYNKQEEIMADLITSIKTKSIDALKEESKALSESLNSAKARKSYYEKLINTGLSGLEKAAMELSYKALGVRAGSTVLRGISAAAHLFPTVFGFAVGDFQPGSAIEASASAVESIAYILDGTANMINTHASYERREQDWDLQKTMATHDTKQIGYQIEANKINQANAEQDLKAHKKSIEQIKEKEEFFRSKFTNQELYNWMKGELARLYFQVYKLALEVAKQAEWAYQYEIDNDRTFIQSGYWNSLKEGLLSGQKLKFDLEQLDKEYHDINERRLEITKVISLKQLAPLELCRLKSEGHCEISLSEKLFDLDFPGHYARKIKDIKITIPAVVGPYENIHASLQQTSNKVVLKSEGAINAIKYLVNPGEEERPENDLLRENWKPNQEIAISKGDQDSGLFELSFGDERYLPFEGTGAVSNWELNLLQATNRFDISTISDVIIHLDYTALNGGKPLSDKVKGLEQLKYYYGNLVINLSSLYPTEWEKFKQAKGNSSELKFKLSTEIFPACIKDESIDKSIYIIPDDGKSICSTTPDTSKMTIKVNNYTWNFNTKKIDNHALTIGSDWNMQISDIDISKVEEIMIMVPYKAEINWR